MILPRNREGAGSREYVPPGRACQNGGGRAPDDSGKGGALSRASHPAWTGCADGASAPHAERSGRRDARSMSKPPPPSASRSTCHPSETSRTSDPGSDRSSMCRLSVASPSCSAFDPPAGIPGRGMRCGRLLRLPGQPPRNARHVAAGGPGFARYRIHPLGGFPQRRDRRGPLPALPGRYGGTCAGSASGTRVSSFGGRGIFRFPERRTHSSCGSSARDSAAAASIAGHSRASMFQTCASAARSLRSQIS